MERYDPEKEFLQLFGQFKHRHRLLDVWRDFVTMAACSISNAVDKSHYDEREKLYLRIIKGYNKQEQAMFPELLSHTVMALEFNPEQDFLGKIYMNLKLGDHNKAQFFTPYSVCQLMAEIGVGDFASEIEKKGYITIHDPCCGAGGTLIAGIHAARKVAEKDDLNFQNHVLITGQDIDPTVALMCYIQISLLGVAGYIKVGNSLIEPMVESDSLEHYWFTPIYFTDVWHTRRLIKKMDALITKKEEKDGQKQD